MIVVFCESNILYPDPIPSTFVPEENKATYLERFFVEVSNPASEVNDSVATAYKVSVNTGVFMNVTSPALPVEHMGTSNTVAVFAMVPDGENRLERSLQRAKDGIKLIMPAQDRLFGTGSEFPSDMSPPGLRWLVLMPSLPGGQSMTWKMRSGSHRNDEFTVPPNHMVQCYALGPFYSAAGLGGETFTGYQIHGYRLDRNGTGQIYGEKLPGGTDEPPRQNIDPAWNVTISDVSTDTLGIPFLDPPPLIISDLITPPSAALVSLDARL